MLGVVDELLTEALAPILRDLRAAGIAEPGVEAGEELDDGDSVSVRLLSPDGSDVSAYVSRSAPAWDRVAAMADQVQEWAIEELWPAASTNWPVCPNHPTGHPLSASTRERVAMWVCPGDGTPFWPVGRLR